MSAVADTLKAADDLDASDIPYISFLSGETTDAAEPEEASNTAIIYAGLGLVGAATAAYFMMRKREKTFSEMNDTLLLDEGYVQV